MIRRPVLVVLATVIVSACTLGAQPSAAATPETNVAVTVTSDGTPGFDMADGTGEDSSANNLRIRTLDTIGYRVDYQFNGVAGQHKTVLLHIDGGSFTAPPPRCGDPVISPHRDSITCTVLSEPDAGVVGTFNVDATVGALRDGSQVTMTATTNAVVAASTASAPPVLATAVPRWDARASYQTNSARQPDEHGVDGFFVMVPMTVEADLTTNDGKGVEGLAGDLTFTVDVTSPGHAVPPYTLVTTPTAAAGHALPLCGPAALAPAYDQPYGAPGADPSATNDTSTDIGGTWSCTQAAPGEPIAVTLSGADLAPVRLPLNSAAPMPLFPRKLLVSMQLTVFVTVTDVRTALGGDGVYGLEWQVSDFDPTGRSGTSNYGTGAEPTTNNTGQHTVVTFSGDGGWDSYFENDYQEMRVDSPTFGPGDYADVRPPFMDPTHFPFVPTQSQYQHAGDGAIASGQSFVQYLTRSRADSPGDVGANTTMCAFVDPATATVVDMPPIVVREVDGTPGATFGSSVGVAAPKHNTGPVWAHTTSRSTGQYGSLLPIDDPIGVVVEYGTGPWAAGDTCGDDASATGWTTDPTTTAGAADGAYPAVSMVRVRTSAALSGTQSVLARVALRADGGAPGDFLATQTAYGDWAAGAPWSGDADTWRHPVYDPQVHSGADSDVYFGDRLTYTERSLLVTKRVVGGDPGELVPGDIVRYEVTGTLFGDPADAVTLTDDLPSGLELIDADVPPTAVSADGRTITWSWGTTVAATTRSVGYRARVTAAAPNGSTLTNTVTGAAEPALAAFGNVLTSSATVRTAPDFVQLDVWKSVDTPTVPIDTAYGFTVSSQNSANVTLTDLAWIDVLPWNGDGRERATTFHGTTRLTGATPSADTTLEYTAADSATIAADPAAESNGPGGATTWCVDAQFGTTGCPADLGAVTAIRATRSQLAPTERMTVGLTFAPAGNQGFDRYSNSVAGRAGETPMLARSEDVTVDVVAPMASRAADTTPTPSAVSDTTRTPAPTGRGDVSDDDAAFGALAFTGGTAAATALAGLGLLVVGTALVALGRRRPAAPGVLYCESRR